MIRAFGWLCAFTLLCGCSPLTYESRMVPMQQLASHPLPAGATYVVIVPPTSVGAAQLADSIRIPGLSKATSPETAEVTIEASVGQATVSNLVVESNQVHRVISSGGDAEFTAYSYLGSLSVPRSLRITSKTHGTVMTDLGPAVTNLTYDTDPGTQQRFTDPSALEWSFTNNRPSLLQKATLSQVQGVQHLANGSLVNAFTAQQITLTLTLATAHKNDPRFAQAANAFSLTVASPASSAADGAAGFAAGMKPALDLWQQIAATPIGEKEEDRAESKGAALYNQAVGLFVIDQLDAAERTASAAQGLGVEARTVFNLTSYIHDRRTREQAQRTKP